MSRLHAPEDVVTVFRDAWNQHDADAIAALFTADARFVNVVGLWWQGREAIREAHSYGFERIFGASTMRLRRTDTRMLGEDAAVVIASWRIAGQSALSGKEAGVRRGVFTFVLQRQRDGGWLAVSAQNTDRISGADTLHASDSGVLGASYQQQG